GRFDFLPDLPRTTTLKVKRHEVAALLGARGDAAPVAAGAPAGGSGDDVVEGVFEAIRAVTRRRCVALGLDSSLQFDASLDSLERVELLCELESRFGVRFPEGLAPRLHRVRDIVTAIEECRQGGRAARDERAT